MTSLKIIGGFILAQMVYNATGLPVMDLPEIEARHFTPYERCTQAFEGSARANECEVLK